MATTSSKANWQHYLRTSWFPAAAFAVWVLGLLSVVYFNSAFHDQTLNLANLITKWDGGWYQSIIQNGYHYVACAQSNVAFFPGYPLLVQPFRWIGFSSVAAASIVSLLCFFATLQLTYRLAKQVGSEATARIAIILMIVTPFSFWFALGYTESLFALLFVGTLTLLQRRNYWAAAVVAGIASGTRVTGAILGVAVVAHFTYHVWWPNRSKWAPAFLKAAGLGAISISGLVAFMLYLKHLTGDGLMFMHIQKYWDTRSHGLSGLKTTFGHLIYGPGRFSNPYALTVLEIASLAALLVLGVYTWRKLSRLWGGLILVSLAIPLATGATTSLNRYVLVLIPAYIALAKLLKTSDRAMLVVVPSAMLGGLLLSIYQLTMIFLG